jgi:hypothetical protein
VATSRNNGGAHWRTLALVQALYGTGRKTSGYPKRSKATAAQEKKTAVEADAIKKRNKKSIRSSSKPPATV